MKKNYFSLLFILLFMPLIIFSQMKISGVVVDEYNDPIAFCDIFIPNTNYYVSTNSDGSFYLETLENHSQLEVEQFGFVSKVIPLNSSIIYNLNIILEEELEEGDQHLDEVVATSMKKYKRKKENPAYQILREIWKRKKTNGIRKYDNYQYQEYEKIEFDLNNLDSNFTSKKIFKDLEFVFKNIDTSSISGKNYLPMFLNETIYEIIGENKPNTREKRNIIASKTSGFDDNEIVAQTVRNLYKEFNIYDNRLNFFNKAFVSPIARDGFSHYDYNIIDTTMVDNIRYIRIKYYPKRESELTFKGSFKVADSIFSIKSVNMQSNKEINVNFVRDIYAELDYTQINDSVYLPESSYIMLDMSLLTKKEKEKGMFAHRTISYKDFSFNNADNNEKIAQNINPYESGAFYKSDEYWTKARHLKLSKDEKNIYQMLDTLKTVPKFKRMVNLVEILGSGYINVWNSLDLGNLYSTFGYNEVEGIRTRFGARTYFSKNDMWRLQAYGAYGFKDNQFKYGAEARYMFNPNTRFILGFGTKRDIEQLGVQLTTQDGIMTRTFASSGLFSRGNNNSLSNINKTNLFAALDPWKNFTLRLDATYQTIKSASPLFNIDYLDTNGNVQSELTNTTYAFTIISKPFAKYSQIGIDRYKHSSTLSPTIVGRYTKGVNGVLGSNFNYDKLELYYNQPRLWGSIGRSDITLEAGKIFGKVPLSLLAIVPGNQSYSIVNGTFSQLNYYEFITDSYVAMHIDHHFNGRFFSYIPLLKKWKLREVAFFRAVWGEISDKNKALNQSNITYYAPSDKIYYEYGFGIENIGLGNFRLFRVDFNWRGNYLNLPNISKFGVKFGLQLTF